MILCSSKDTDKKKRETRQPVRKEEKKEQIEKEDVKKHLVAAFVSFLEREFESESVDEQFKELIDAAKTSLSTAYDLPDDDSFKIPKQLEDIFFREAKHLVKIKKPQVDVKKEENVEDNEEFEEQEEDDDGNWKRRQNSKSRDTEESSEHEDGFNRDNFQKEGLEGSMEVGDNLEDNLEDELNPADDNEEDEIVRDEDHELLVNV